LAVGQKGLRLLKVKDEWSELMDYVIVNLGWALLAAFAGGFTVAWFACAKVKD
jgi:hypothetical protein